MKTMDEETFSNQIDAYLDGKLQPGAHQTFAAQMDGDAALRDRVDQQRLARQVVESWVAGDVRNKVRQLRDLGDPPMVAEPKIFRLRNWAWAAALAAMFAGAVFYFWKMGEPQAVKPELVEKTEQGQPSGHTNEPAMEAPKAAENPKTSPPIAAIEPPKTGKPDYRKLALNAAATSYEPLENLRGEQDALAKAAMLFKGRQFYEAANLLDPLPAADGLAALELRAHARFECGMYAGAASDFEKLAREAENTAQIQQAEWGQLLAMMAQAGAKKADFEPLLGKIANDPGHVRQKDAAALRQTVRK